MIPNHQLEPALHYLTLIENRLYWHDAELEQFLDLLRTKSRPMVRIRTSAANSLVRRPDLNGYFVSLKCL